MLARPLSAFLARYGIHYAWVIVAVTFLTALTTAGAVGIPGALILPLTHEFGWDTAQISSALAIRLLLFGLMAPFAAALIGRYGVRRMVAVAITLIVAGLGGAMVMSQIWHLVVTWGIVVGIGTGLTALVLSAIVANRWFVARRGLVIGMLAASTSTGQLVFLPMTASLAQAYGWRVALMPPIGALILVAILMLLFMRDWPSDIGLAAYGETAPAAPRPAQHTPVYAAIGRAFTVLGEAAVTPVFWILFATFFVCGLSTNGLIQTHFIPFCADYGLPAVTAASVLAAMGICDIAGTIGSGWLSDRIAAGKLLCWYYGLRGLALLFLPSSGFSTAGLSFFALFYGLDWIATVPPTVKLANGAFGRERAPIVFGWVFTAHQLGAATAAYGAGLSRTVLATYLPAFYVAGAACLVAAALALMARPETTAALARPAASPKA
jgi:predicted MFS family arabinose efflux permease